MARTNNFWLYGCQLRSSLRLRIVFRRRVQKRRTARRHGVMCHSWNSSIELSHGHDSYCSTWYPTQISITQCTSASASSFLQSIFSIRTLKFITQGRIVTTVAANPRILRPQRRWAVSWRAITALSYNNTKNLWPNWKKLNCSWNQGERKEGFSPKPLPIDEYFELNRDNQSPGEPPLPFHTTTTQNIPQKCIKVIYFRMQMVECSLAGSWCEMLRKYQNWELMTFMEFEDMYTVITWSFHHYGLCRVNAPPEFHCAPISLQAVYSQRFVRICNMDTSGTDTG